MLASRECVWTSKHLLLHLNEKVGLRSVYLTRSPSSEECVKAQIWKRSAYKSSHVEVPRLWHVWTPAWGGRKCVWACVCVFVVTPCPLLKINSQVEEKPFGTSVWWAKAKQHPPVNRKGLSFISLLTWRSTNHLNSSSIVTSYLSSSLNKRLFAFWLN